ncbi:WD40 repeat-like protein [Rhizopogon salebrosus TDB-379]|nr:WD40 repeat-like protein [Rhizopogon salebrosus TDB-379]
MTKVKPVAAPRQMRHCYTAGVKGIAFFNDGRWLITGSKDSGLGIWDVQKGTPVGAPFKGRHGSVSSVAVSPDDKRIASGGRDNRVIIWDVESRQMAFDPLVKHTDWVNSVCFSPKGKRLASGSSDSTVIVWDTETGAILAIHEGHRCPVLSVAFSPDGLKLASGSSDHTMRVWRSDVPELVLEIPHKSYVGCVVWSPDGQQLVSASDDKKVNFWVSTTDHRPITCGSCLSHRDVHPVQYSLRYNVMPYVGMLSYGEAARTLEPINFPEARDSVS